MCLLVYLFCSISVLHGQYRIWFPGIAKFHICHCFTARHQKIGERGVWGAQCRTTLTLWINHLCHNLTSVNIKAGNLSEQNRHLSTWSLHLACRWLCSMLLLICCPIHASVFLYVMLHVALQERYLLFSGFHGIKSLHYRYYGCLMQ